MKTFTPALAGAIVLTAALSGVALAGPSFSLRDQAAAQSESTVQTRLAQAEPSQPTTRSLVLTAREAPPAPAPAAQTAPPQASAAQTLPPPAPAVQTAARTQYRYTAADLEALGPKPHLNKRRVVSRPRYAEPAVYLAPHRIQRPAFRLVRLGRW